MTITITLARGDFPDPGELRAFIKEAGRRIQDTFSDTHVGFFIRDAVPESLFQIRIEGTVPAHTLDSDLEAEIAEILFDVRSSRQGAQP